ncbi:50S ribosomal protein L11 methyltransferase [Parvularcula sp. IMCC14364]|uniref:50S ribosomal protein L11 methyltransferase n=1 Tax=Parvularcula sp. IMCC14364 TaxID=3067902 RepID=UPI002741F072|nr:50S ribosomal protein L11 methyltransferase [Parvularcula sp. IMCC14364]
MPSYKAIWTGPHEDMSQIADLLSDIYFPPADAVSLTKDDSAQEDNAANWRVDAYFSEPPEKAALGEFLAEYEQHTRPQIEELPDQDWVAHALEGLGIVRCGRFVLYGVHDAQKLPNDTNDIPVRIDANQAFGTGHHPTTAGCLEMLDKLADLSPANVLDLGTGSAVLAIAAAKLWDTRILATDIDQTSVEIAAENATFNSASGIHFLTAAGFDHSDITATGPFDFVFANILAGPLVELSTDMATHTSPGATVMLAGLLAEQTDKVIRAYQTSGFDLVERTNHDTWPVLVFRRA